jgi:hypothetical protein
VSCQQRQYGIVKGRVAESSRVQELLHYNHMTSIEAQLDWLEQRLVGELKDYAIQASERVSGGRNELTGRFSPFLLQSQQFRHHCQSNLFHRLEQWRGKLGDKVPNELALIQLLAGLEHLF